MLKLYLVGRNYLAKLSNQRGQSMTEYILILAAVAVAVIVTWQLLGNTLKEKLNEVINNLRQ